MRCGCGKCGRFWLLMAAVCVGLLLFFSLLMMGINFAAHVIGFSAYARGVIVGMASCILPHAFLRYAFGGDDHECTPRRARGRG